jgi:hypothetical protein
MSGQEPVVRVGDTEREAVAAQIREHYAAGRLSHEEMTERLDAAMAARTTADLAPLTPSLGDHGVDRRYHGDHGVVGLQPP